MFPAGLDVRNFESIADGLNSADRGAVRRAEHSNHPQSKLVTHWWYRTTQSQMVVNQVRSEGAYESVSQSNFTANQVPILYLKSEVLILYLSLFTLCY